MTFAEMTGTEVYIVHTSNDLAVQAALSGRRRGVNVHIETVIPYLVLDESYAQLPISKGLSTLCRRRFARRASKRSFGSR